MESTLYLSGDTSAGTVISTDVADSRSSTKADRDSSLGTGSSPDPIQGAPAQSAPEVLSQVQVQAHATTGTTPPRDVPGVNRGNRGLTVVGNQEADDSPSFGLRALSNDGTKPRAEANSSTASTLRVPGTSED